MIEFLLENVSAKEGPWVWLSWFCFMMVFLSSAAVVNKKNEHLRVIPISFLVLSIVFWGVAAFG